MDKKEKDRVEEVRSMLGDRAADMVKKDATQTDSDEEATNDS